MVPYLVGIHGMRAAVASQCKGIHALHAVRRLLVQGHALQALLQRLSIGLLPLLLRLLHRHSAPCSVQSISLGDHQASVQSASRRTRVRYSTEQHYPHDIRGPTSLRETHPWQAKSGEAGRH